MRCPAYPSAPKAASYGPVRRPACDRPDSLRTRLLLARSYVSCDMANPLLIRGFAVFGGWGFCLLQVQRDGGVEEFEDTALGFGGDREGGHDGSVGAVLDVVAGQRAQMGEQGTEGPHWVAVVVFAV